MSFLYTQNCDMMLLHVPLKLLDLTVCQTFDVPRCNLNSRALIWTVPSRKSNPEYKRFLPKDPQIVLAMVYSPVRGETASKLPMCRNP